MPKKGKGLWLRPPLGTTDRQVLDVLDLTGSATRQTLAEKIGVSLSCIDQTLRRLRQANELTHSNIGTKPRGYHRVWLRRQ